MKKAPSYNGHVQADRDVPFPAPRKLYPWKTMEIGDSFLVPWTIPQTVSAYNARHAPKHFIARRTPQGIRVWRDR